jgi:hypothetical protein
MEIGVKKEVGMVLVQGEVGNLFVRRGVYFHLVLGDDVQMH